MPRFCIVILLLAGGASGFADSPPETARAQTFQTTMGFYASPAGNVALEMENRRGWRDSSAGPNGLSSLLLLGSAVQMLIGVPQERRADRLFALAAAQPVAQRVETYQQIYRSLA